MVYYQYISDGKLPKRMLVLNGSNVTFHFDYPKVEIKSLQFPCETFSNEPTVIKQTANEKFDKYGSSEMEKIFESYKSKI